LNKDNYIQIFKAAFGKLFQWSDFYSPQWFWALLIIPIIIIVYFYKEKNDVIELHYSSSKGFGTNTPIALLRHIPFVLTILSIAFFTLALARPQDAKSWEETKTEGIDMVVTLDVSQSMEAKDFKPNRLEASKKIASEFINTRKNDRFGLVIFGDESFTQCPLTIDHKRIIELFKDVSIGMVGGSTAIGSGIATSVKRLKDSEAKSKVIILLTDGVNNSGFIDPKIASELAAEYEIKTYTIGIGSNGTAKAPVGIMANGKFKYGITKVEIDEKLLKSIADLTGGQYFRATDNDKLKQIYSVINKLEKTEIEEFKYTNYKEKYRPFIFFALTIMVLEFILRNSLFRSFI